MLESLAKLYNILGISIDNFSKVGCENPAGLYVAHISRNSLRNKFDMLNSLIECFFRDKT